MTVAVRRWRSSNCWLGRPYGPPIAFVLHSETGGESGTVAEFLNSSSQWSSHYTVGLDGTLDCYVDPGDRAWSNGVLEPGNLWTRVAEACGVDVALNPNHVTVSDMPEGLPALVVPKPCSNPRLLIATAPVAAPSTATTTAVPIRYLPTFPSPAGVRLKSD